DKAALKFDAATKKLATTPAKATAGTKFSLSIGASSLSLPVFSATGLPKGLSINKATGEISGVGTVPGAYTAKVTVTSAAGNKITQNVKITVSVPSWAKGTFYGTAKPDGKTLSYLKFAVAATGKVSGKVTYKGKAYSFTAKYKRCTATKATFAPSVKVGKKTFKPGTVTVKTLKVGGLSLVEAANSKATFAAQKKPNLVKKGKTLAKLIGKSFTFTKKTKNSGLTKSKDKLEVKLANGDAAKVTGVVGGKKLTAISWVTLVSGKATKGGSEVYTLYVDIIDASLKYERTLVIKATVSTGGVKATAAFAK
ncbi:MAG: putative Ig domain-containing protein, partial [Kiritimatiellae bacterium]|nr:putative Ig domain-containing protein [Kiritimatiellia bacterium]